MHDTPAPEPFTATQVVHLIGGPLCGHNAAIPENCHEFYDEHAPSTPEQMESHYRYCPHASARLSRPCFIHSTIAHDLYAR